MSTEQVVRIRVTERDKPLKFVVDQGSNKWGTATPNHDFERQNRPNPVASNPDAGADEVP